MSLYSLIALLNCIFTIHSYIILKNTVYVVKKNSIITMINEKRTIYSYL